MWRKCLMKERTGEGDNRTKGRRAGEPGVRLWPGLTGPLPQQLLTAPLPHHLQEWAVRQPWAEETGSRYWCLLFPNRSHPSQLFPPSSLLPTLWGLHVRRFHLETEMTWACGPGPTTDLGAILGMTLGVLLYTVLDWTTLGFLPLLSV